MSVLDDLRHRRPIVQPDSPAASQESFHSISIIGSSTRDYCIRRASMAWRDKTDEKVQTSKKDRKSTNRLSHFWISFSLDPASSCNAAFLRQGQGVG